MLLKHVTSIDNLFCHVIYLKIPQDNRESLCIIELDSSCQIDMNEVHKMFEPSNVIISNRRIDFSEFVGIGISRYPTIPLADLTKDYVTTVKEKYNGCGIRKIRGVLREPECADYPEHYTTKLKTIILSIDNLHFNPKFEFLNK